MVQGNSFGFAHLSAPEETKSCGTFFWFRYFCTAEFDGVPRLFSRNDTPSCSTSRRVCSTALGGR